MNEEYIVKKCPVCGAVIRVLKGKGDSITCCGELMVDCVPNTVDAAVEKHKPEVVVDGDKINVTVNHVMEDDHYIEWISISFLLISIFVFSLKIEKGIVVLDKIFSR